MSFVKYIWEVKSLAFLGNANGNIICDLSQPLKCSCESSLNKYLAKLNILRDEKNDFEMHFYPGLIYTFSTSFQIGVIYVIAHSELYFKF